MFLKIASSYGYTRGSPLKRGAAVHIPGVGDFVMAEVTVLEDPCALPTELKNRSLNQQERVIYGPMSDLGAVFVDKDAAYVSLNKPALRFDASAPDKTEGEQMVLDLQKAAVPLDDALEDADLKLFASSSAPLRRPALSQDVEVEANASEEEDDDDDDDDDEEHEEMMDEDVFGADIDGDDDDDDEDDDEDDDDDDDEDEDPLRAKMRQRGLESFAERKKEAKERNLYSLVYESEKSNSNAKQDDDGDDDEFFKLKMTGK